MTKSRIHFGRGVFAIRITGDQPQWETPIA